MTAVQVYAFFVLPFIFLGAGIGVVYLTRWLDRRGW